MDMLGKVEVIVGTYEELTLGFRLVKDSEETQVSHFCVLFVADLLQTS